MSCCEGCWPKPAIDIKIDNSCNSDCNRCCCCFPFMRIFGKKRQSEEAVSTAEKVEHVRRKTHRHHHHKHIDETAKK